MENEQLLKDINDRLTAIGEQVSEQRLQTIVQGHLDKVLQDKEFVRKMRFGPVGNDTQLLGTKFARWGLTLADIEFLYDLQRSLKGQRSVGGYGVYGGPSPELENTFNAISEAVYLPDAKVREIDKAALDNEFPRIPIRAFHGRDRILAAQGKWELTEAYQSVIRAMDTAESGYGSQLIGAQYVGELWDAARKESIVLAQLGTFEMTAPTAYLPVEVDIPEMLLVSESTASNYSDYATVKTGSNRVSVAAKKFVIHQMWSGEMEEDSIIPFVPFLRRQGQLALAHYGDSLVLNGDDTNADTGNINLSDANPADTKHYLAFDGILHAPLVDVSTNKVSSSGLAVTWDNLMDMRKLMLDRTYLHDWSHPTSPDDLLYVADPETCDQIAKLDEVVTIDKYGPQATILTGEVSRIGRHRLLGTIAMSLTLNNGTVSTTAASNIYGRVAAFNKRGCVVGWRRRVKVESERIIATDQTRIVYSLRMGFGRFTPTGAASGIKWAACRYYIGL
jgi:hypothetical protein